jgi:hypothetical protein
VSVHPHHILGGSRLTGFTSRYVWWARKAEDKNTSTHAQDPVRDDELIQTDEEDNEQHAETDVTQASVDQLSALAVSDEEPTSTNEPAEVSVPKALGKDNVDSASLLS